MMRILLGLTLAGLLISSARGAEPEQPAARPRSKLPGFSNSAAAPKPAEKKTAETRATETRAAETRAAETRAAESRAETKTSTGSARPAGKAKPAAGGRTAERVATAAKRPSVQPPTPAFDGRTLVNYHPMVQSSDMELYKASGLTRKRLLESGGQRLKAAKFELSAEPDLEAIMLGANVGVEKVKDGEGFVGGIVLQAYVIRFPEENERPASSSTGKDDEENVVEGEPVLVWTRKHQVVEATPAELGKALEEGLKQLLDDFTAQWNRSQAAAPTARR